MVERRATRRIDQPLFLRCEVDNEAHTCLSGPENSDNERIHASRDQEKEGGYLVLPTYSSGYMQGIHP